MVCHVFCHRCNHHVIFVVAVVRILLVVRVHVVAFEIISHGVAINTGPAVAAHALPSSNVANALTVWCKALIWAGFCVADQNCSFSFKVGPAALSLGMEDLKLVILADCQIQVVKVNRPALLRVYSAQVDCELAVNEYKHVVVAREGKGLASTILEDDADLGCEKELQNGFSKVKLKWATGKFVLQERECDRIGLLWKHLMEQGLEEVGSRVRCEGHTRMCNTAESCRRIPPPLTEESYERCGSLEHRGTERCRYSRIRHQVERRLQNSICKVGSLHPM